MQKKRKSMLGNKRFGIAMLMPAFLMILLLQLYPLAAGISYAFTNKRLDRPNNSVAFIGLKNFIEAFTDKKFYDTVLFTLVNAVCVVVLAYVIGLALALLLNRKLRGRGLYRSLVLLPWVVSSTVVATNWKWILNDRYGIVNTVLQQWGLIGKPIQFFAVPLIAKLTVISVGTWKTIPFMCIVILAALQSIPFEYYEAASIDGANFRQKLSFITLPEIKSVTVMVTTLQFIWQFNNFENIYLLTGGGPNGATYTLPIYIYNMAFVKNRISYSASIAVIVMIFMLFFAFIRFRLEARPEE